MKAKILINIYIDTISELKIIQDDAWQRKIDWGGSPLESLQTEGFQEYALDLKRVCKKTESKYKASRPYLIRGKNPFSGAQGLRVSYTSWRSKDEGMVAVRSWGSWELFRW